MVIGAAAVIAAVNRAKDPGYRLDRIMWPGSRTNLESRPAITHAGLLPSRGYVSLFQVVSCSPQLSPTCQTHHRREMEMWMALEMWELWSFFIVRIQNLSDMFHLLRLETALMQIGTLGTRQGEDHESARGLLHRSGPFRLVRMPVGDSETIRSQDNARSVEDRELHTLDDDEDDDDEEDDEEEEIQISWRRPHAKTPKWFPPVTTPQEAGKRLLVSGEFGRIGVETRSRNGGTSFARAIVSRQTKLRQTPMQDVTNVSGVYVHSVITFHSATHADYRPQYQWYGRRVSYR